MMSRVTILKLLFVLLMGLLLVHCGPKAICAPDEKKCDGNNILTCSADGTTWGSEACAVGETCEQGACKKEKPAVVCKAGEKKCDSDKALVCKADGSGWDETACQVGEECESGKCKKKIRLHSR